MKKNKWMIMFMLLPLIVTIISLLFLPDKIVVRFGGGAVQYGSKFSLLICPILGIWIGGIMLLVSSHVEHAEQEALVKKIFYVCLGIVCFAELVLLLTAFLIRGDGGGIKIVEIVTGCFTGGIAVLLAVYVSFTARQKGPILSNSYMWLSEEEKKKADTKAEYRVVTIIFGALSLICFMLTISILTSWAWPLKVMWILLAFVIVYAVYDSVKTSLKK